MRQVRLDALLTWSHLASGGPVNVALRCPLHNGNLPSSLPGIPYSPLTRLTLQGPAHISPAPWSFSPFSWPQVNPPLKPRKSYTLYLFSLLFICMSWLPAKMKALSAQESASSINILFYHIFRNLRNTKNNHHITQIQQWSPFLLPDSHHHPSHPPPHGAGSCTLMRLPHLLQKCICCK